MHHDLSAPQGQAPRDSFTCGDRVSERAQEIAQAVAGSIARLAGSADADDADLDSVYYHASTMASLNPRSEAAIRRLRAYAAPPSPVWHRIPARMRAAVLVLLYADRRGDLRVVITMRAASLRSFSGHAALPGGKADHAEETPFQIARREASEEIGLPLDDARLPKPFRIEHLCTLPPSLARTHLVVTPCVAFLHADRGRGSATPPSSSAPSPSPPLVEDAMIPRLDAREVAAVFSAPFYNFLKTTDMPPAPGQALPPGHWYDGSWVSFKDHPWRVHNFYVPVNNQHVSRPERRRDHAQANLAGRLEADAEEAGRFKVWGMTARVLVDVARIAYAEEPEQEHNKQLGDDKIILLAEEEGHFQEVGKDMAKGQQAGEDGPAKM